MYIYIYIQYIYILKNLPACCTEILNHLKLKNTVIAN